jgi:hypothetical protein
LTGGGFFTTRGVLSESALSVVLQCEIASAKFALSGWLNDHGIAISDVSLTVAHEWNF